MPEVIGIYSSPPPEECSIIHSQRVADIGAVPLVRSATRLRDRITRALGDLIG